MVSPVYAIDPAADLVRRIRGEYLEMPGLRLTAHQAERLFGLSAATCDVVMRTLVASGFLSRMRDGTLGLTEAVSR